MEDQRNAILAGSRLMANICVMYSIARAADRHACMMGPRKKKKIELKNKPFLKCYLIVTKQTRSRVQL